MEQIQNKKGEWVDLTPGLVSDGKLAELKAAGKYRVKPVEPPTDDSLPNPLEILRPQEAVSDATAVDPLAGKPTSEIGDFLQGSIGAFTPMTRYMQNEAYKFASDQNWSPLAKEIYGAVGGMGGIPLDAVGLVTSPVKQGIMPAAQKAGTAISNILPEVVNNVANAVGKKVGNFLAPVAERTLLGQTVRNVAANTADATLLNNAARMVEGESPSFGAAEIAGGLAGGAVGAIGGKQAMNDLIKARIYASKKNSNIQFAEKRYDNNKGHGPNRLKDQQAVEKVIADNKKIGETFEDAVMRLREQGYALDKEYYKFMDSPRQRTVATPNGETVMNTAPVKDALVYTSIPEIRNKVVNSSLNGTSGLGHDFEITVGRQVDNIFQEYMRTIRANRMQADPNYSNLTREQINGLIDRIPYDYIVKDLGNLTLGEIDYIKRGMQARTSHYNRGQGTMERQGLESTSNYQGESGIRDFINEYAEHAFDNVNWAEIEDPVIRNLEQQGYLSQADAKKYMDLNHKRAQNIGVKKIMESAEYQYNRSHEKLGSIIGGLREINAYSTKTAPVARNLGTIMQNPEDERRDAIGNFKFKASNKP